MGRYLKDALNILDIDPDHAKARERLRAIEPDAAPQSTSSTLFGRVFNCNSR